MQEFDMDLIRVQEFDTDLIEESFGMSMEDYSLD